MAKMSQAASKQQSKQQASSKQAANKQQGSSKEAASKQLASSSKQAQVKNNTIIRLTEHCIFTSRGSELSFTNLLYRRVQIAWQKKSYKRFSNLVSKIFKKSTINHVYVHIILTAPDLWKPPCWRQLIILSSVSFHFLSKNDHINIGQYGVLMTQVIFTLQF